MIRGKWMEIYQKRTLEATQRGKWRSCVKKSQRGEANVIAEKDKGNLQ